MTETPNVTRDTSYLLKLAKTKMPFGKYQGKYLIDLPEAYLVWFSQKGFPEGELGSMLQAIYEIKTNGLEHMVRKIKNF
ncbi:MAG: DUF3820 family protein [Syntrophaceae bacterium]|nr:DUF3820 family protein [Syntrophaceae bacterium]